MLWESGELNRQARRTYRFHLQCWRLADFFVPISYIAYNSTAKIEAIYFSEISAGFTGLHGFIPQSYITNPFNLWSSHKINDYVPILCKVYICRDRRYCNDSVIQASWGSSIVRYSDPEEPLNLVHINQPKWVCAATWWRKYILLPRRCTFRTKG
jgi:hypothetical protein